jgi:hypothetical protein
MSTGAVQQYRDLLGEVADGRTTDLEAGWGAMIDLPLLARLRASDVSPTDVLELVEFDIEDHVPDVRYLQGGYEPFESRQIGQLVPLPKVRRMREATTSELRSLTQAAHRLRRNGRIELGLNRGQRAASIYVARVAPRLT